MSDNTARTDEHYVSKIRWLEVQDKLNAANQTIAELRQQVERLTRENTCDVCGGTGKPASNKPCMCQGTGKATDAIQWMRERLFEDDKENERLTRENKELNSKLDTITTDVNYEGGIQYWIQKHSTALMLSVELAEKLSTAQAANAAMRESLEFIGDPNNFGFNRQTDIASKTLKELPDAGKRFQQCIEAIEEIVLKCQQEQDGRFVPLLIGEIKTIAQDALASAERKPL